uniref:Uncharacterized protein n=1 Tax=Oryza glumipatula TaxID=40148 RepID=A0A0D9ZXI4_9ORYZ
MAWLERAKSAHNLRVRLPLHILPAPMVVANASVPSNRGTPNPSDLDVVAITQPHYSNRLNRAWNPYIQPCPHRIINSILASAVAPP